MLPLDTFVKGDYFFTENETCKSLKRHVFLLAHPSYVINIICPVYVAENHFVIKYRYLLGSID